MRSRTFILHFRSHILMLYYLSHQILQYALTKDYKGKNTQLKDTEALKIENHREIKITNCKSYPINLLGNNLIF